MESSSQLLNPGLYILSVLSLKTATLERYIVSNNSARKSEYRTGKLELIEGHAYMHIPCFVESQGAGQMGRLKLMKKLFIDRWSGIADRNDSIYKKRTGNRRGRPIARIVTRIGWAKLSCSVAGPGGGSGRPDDEHEERQHYDSYRQCQPAHESGFVHPLSPFAQNVKLKHEYRKQIPCQKITSFR